MADDWYDIDFDLAPETPEQRAAAEARAREAGDKVVGDADQRPAWCDDLEWEDIKLAEARRKAHDKQGERGATPGAPPKSADEIKLRAGETENIVNELERRLIASNRGLYQRGGVIVTTGSTEMPTHGGKKILTQIIARRGDYALLEDAELVAKFLKFNAKIGKWVPASPPLSLVYTLKDREHRLRFPVLTGIVNCPSICDGELLDRPGYDPGTGYLFDPLSVTFPRVPDCPTKQDAERALRRILRLLETFDFVGPRDLAVANNDRAVALSLIITAVARRGLPFAPLHGFDAPTAGSGKSKIVDLASIISTGHEAGVVALGKNEEETHKTLSSLLMRGDPFIAIDNCDGPLEGALLNQMLTKQRVRASRPRLFQDRDRYDLRRRHRHRQ